MKIIRELLDAFIVKQRGQQSLLRIRSNLAWDCRSELITVYTLSVRTTMGLADLAFVDNYFVALSSIVGYSWPRIENLVRNDGMQLILRDRPVTNKLKFLHAPHWESKDCN